MIMNGQRMLVQVTVKQPLSQGQRWFVSAPVKIPEKIPGQGRGVAYTRAMYGHRAQWVITTFTAEFACAIARDLIKKEIAMRKDALVTYARMVRELTNDSGSGSSVS